jgi:hypothetical protein
MPAIVTPGRARHDAAEWAVFTERRAYAADIDWYRRRHGKAAGEARFFAEQRAVETLRDRGNLLMVGGVSLMLECLIGNGTGTAAQALTFLNGSNGYLGVGDSSTAEAPTQTDLQAASNKTRQVFDSTFPKHTDGTTAKAITGATNATPISVTATAHGFSTGDFVVISQVGGNTAANGLFQITVVDANTFTLNGSAGSGAYTSGGNADKSRCAVFQATFGTGSANYVWNEWITVNGSSGGRALNRKVVALGTKTSAASWALLVAVGVS